MESYRSTTVLVTGATGFLSSHLVPALLDKGANVTGLSLEKRHYPALKNFSYIHADLKDKDKLKETVRKIEPSIIFHLAAYPNEEPTFENTDNCIQNNIQGTMNLIHSLKGISFDSFIHIGSYKEYSGNKTPFRETNTIFPMSSYAISKACTEMFCKAYHQIYGLPLVSLRLPAVYGPGQSDKNLIPYLIKSSLSGHPLRLTKGEQKRELIYISDVIDALIMASINKKACGEIINVGTNKEYRLKEIVKLILSLSNSRIKPEFGAIPYRKNEIWNMKGDNSKARSILNWEPKIGLKEGLVKTITYYKNVQEKASSKKQNPK